MLSFLELHNIIVNKKLVIFGARKGASYLLERYPDLQKEVAYFVDNNSYTWGKIFFGRAVYSPEQLLNENKNELVVFVASCKFIPIRNQLRNLGVKNIFFSYEFDPVLFDKVSDHIDFPSVSKEVMEEVAGLLSDEKSKYVFTQILEKRKVYDSKYLDISEDCMQYFIPEVLDVLDGDEFYVDGGPYDGQEIDAFMNYCPRVSGVHAFEPDLNSFLKLKKKYCNTPLVHLNNLALWRENGELDFCCETLGSISHLCADQKSGQRMEKRKVIKTVALDHFLPLNDIRVGGMFIKMDIEGAETEALYGTQRIIKEYHPKLAICVYHKPNDIVEIPLFIKRLVPEYKILLRHHGTVDNETVMYAI